MEEEKKKLLFCSYFWHISVCFYSNFNRESSLDEELIFASNEYQFNILLMGPSTQKTRNTWKNVMMTSSSRFFRCIQRALPIEIWVKTQDMSKIRTQKVVFFFLPPKLINIILLFYYFNYYFILFLRRPISDPKIPLMMKENICVIFYTTRD